jgi:hypothetical protein
MKAIITGKFGKRYVLGNMGIGNLCFKSSIHDSLAKRTELKQI